MRKQLQLLPIFFLIIDEDKWQLVTGTQEEVFDMAKHYMLGVLKDNTTADSYIHSGHFVLMDKERKIRGYYSGTNAKVWIDLSLI